MEKISHYIQHMHIKYCTEVSMQTCLWHPMDTRERAEVSLYAACLHVCLPQRGLSSWVSQELPLTREPGGQGTSLFFPVHRFQVHTVLDIFTQGLTAFIFVLSPLLFFPCIAQQAAAAGAEGTFPGLFEWGDTNRSR